MNTVEHGNEEIALHDIWCAIVNHKVLIVGIFAVAMIGVLITNSILRDVYRVQAFYSILDRGNGNLYYDSSLTAQDFAEIFGKSEYSDQNLLQKIFPDNHPFIDDIQIAAVKSVGGSKTNVITVTLDAYDREKLSTSLNEFSVFVNKHPVVKRSMQLREEVIKKRIAELETNLSEANKLSRNFKGMLQQGRVLTIGFNPVEIETKISDMRIIKLELEKELEFLSAIQPLEIHFYSDAVKPRRLLNIAVTAVFSLFLGIFLAVIFDHSRRKRAN
ncbi:MAG: hypothetical protein K9K75_01500 [Deltaproteobacteria bacterium]|nr:hypothetical protein [Deltaproteobacteria bacterium]